MRTGDIILVHFPFTDLSDTKVRPAVVVCETPDVHQDIIACMISSVIPNQPNSFEIQLQHSAQNGLRAISIIRVYRIATVGILKILATIGKLSQQESKQFSAAFQALIP